MIISLFHKKEQSSGKKLLKNFSYPGCTHEKAGI